MIVVNQGLNLWTSISVVGPIDQNRVQGARVRVDDAEGVPFP